MKITKIFNHYEVGPLNEADYRVYINTEVMTNETMIDDIKTLTGNDDYWHIWDGLAGFRVCFSEEQHAFWFAMKYGEV